MTNARNEFQGQAEASANETIEDARRWLAKGKPARARSLVESAIEDAESQVGKVTIPGAREAITHGVGILRAFLATLE